MPFTAEIVAYAKALVVEDGGRIRDRSSVDAELARIAERIHADRAQADRELRLARRSLLRMGNAQRETPAVASPPDDGYEALAEADFFDIDPDLIEAMPLLDEDGW